MDARLKGGGRERRLTARWNSGQTAGLDLPDLVDKFGPGKRNGVISGGVDRSDRDCRHSTRVVTGDNRGNRTVVGIVWPDANVSWRASGLVVVT